MGGKKKGEREREKKSEEKKILSIEYTILEKKNDIPLYTYTVAHNQNGGMIGRRKKEERFFFFKRKGWKKVGQ